MNHLDRLEATSVHLLREAYANFKALGMLWSIGKDSTVLLYLARKAFLGHVPFPLIHIDTRYKIPEMIRYRDRLVAEWRLEMIVGVNESALARGHSFPQGTATRLECCKALKTDALRQTLLGAWPRYRYDHDSHGYRIEEQGEPFTGVIAGIRADEEGSRSKERYFSRRDGGNEWDIADQPPRILEPAQNRLRPRHACPHPSPARLDGAERLGVQSPAKRSRPFRFTTIRAKANAIARWGCYPLHDAGRLER